MDKNRQEKSGQMAISSMLASSLCVTLICVLGKTISENFSLPLLVFIRFFFPFMMISWILFVTGIPKETSWTWAYLKPHFIRACFSLLGQYAIFFYLTHHTALDGTALLATAPLHMHWMQRVYDHKPFKKHAPYLLALGFLGALLMLKPDTHTIFHISTIFGFVAGLMTACSQRALHHVANKGTPPIVSSFLLYGFASLMAAGPLAISSHTMPHSHEFQYLWDSDLLIVFILFSVISISNQVLRAKAYRLTPSLSLLTPIGYSTIIFSALFDRFFYHVTPDLYSCIGAIFIALSGIAMLRSSTQASEPAMAMPSKDTPLIEGAT